MFRVAGGIIPSLLFCLVFATAQDNLPSTARVWKDSTGRFQVTAKLIERVGEKVDLLEGKITGSQPLSDLGRIYYPKLSFNPSEDKLYLSSIGRVLK
ncbi:SHD1 domain-containing protein [Rhodopirellula sp. P2]|uniref:SHD1 domain-containing protein n=1 Tax=Rhodopirellula sp. P2 TaxID=2127060 RepID=UPI002368B910|nr:SHD1 domain-containing protein [Rhodopirellula sp. P2]WDQ17801.1 SHD1 domain-containing protein [Rhodopirellula sp. P2]